LDSKKLGEVSQTLAKLSKEPDAKAEMAFLIDYFQEVHKSLKVFRCVAEQQAQCAEAEAQGKACPSNLPSNCLSTSNDDTTKEKQPIP
jgi:hypothetical protein